MPPPKTKEIVRIAPLVAGRLTRIAPLLAALVIIAGDRLTKLLIQRSMGLFDSASVVPDWLRIVHTENPGAAFGMLAEGSPAIRGVVLIGISVVVLIFVLAALMRKSRAFGAPLTRFGLGLILGGAFGNVYDRIVHGTVTDFIEVYHGTWSFPAFNIADSAITAGAVLLFLDLLRPRRKDLERPPEFARK